MFQKFVYSLSLVIFVGSSWAARETKVVDDGEWLNDLPVMVRHDARQFHSTVHFSELPGNPYAAYFQGALIGKTLGVESRADEVLMQHWVNLLPRQKLVQNGHILKSHLMLETQN